MIILTHLLCIPDLNFTVDRRIGTVVPQRFQTPFGLIPNQFVMSEVKQLAAGRKSHSDHQRGKKRNDRMSYCIIIYFFSIRN